MEPLDELIDCTLNPGHGRSVERHGHTPENPPNATVLAGRTVSIGIDHPPRSRRLCYTPPSDRTDRESASWQASALLPKMRPVGGRMPLRHPRQFKAC